MTTSSGLDRNVAGAVAYVLGAITGIYFLLTEEDDDVRFHAAQSILFSLAVFVAFVALAIVQSIVFVLPVIGATLGWLFLMVAQLIRLAVLVLWLYLMYRAYDGDRYHLPAMGDVVEDLAASDVGD